MYADAVFFFGTSNCVCEIACLNVLLKMFGFFIRLLQQVPKSDLIKTAGSWSKLVFPMLVSSAAKVIQHFALLAHQYHRKSGFESLDNESVLSFCFFHHPLERYHEFLPKMEEPIMIIFVSIACILILRIAWLCWSLQITSRRLYEPLSTSCCSFCESLRILADFVR